MKLWVCDEDQTELWGAEAYDWHVLYYPSHHPKLISENAIPSKGITV